MKKKLENFDELVIEHLKDPSFAIQYLKENWEYQGPNKLELLLQALHRIAKARGMTEVANESGISRRNLYKMFSGTGSPSAQTLFSVMSALGVRLSIEQTKTPKRKGITNRKKAI
jgi:probable addiction module antidote protein